MEIVKDSIYVETEYSGCNPSFVVTGKGIVMIDVPGQKPFEALEWKKEIAKYGKVTYIVNTDHHIDHCIGNYFFDGELIVYEGTMNNLFAENRLDAYRAFVKMIGPSSRYLLEILDKHLYFTRKPMFTYTDKMTIYLGQEVFELIHVRGHTDAETIVYMPIKKTLFTGDNVCTSGLPNMAESCPLDWLDALTMMEKMDVEVLVPGHGKIGNKDSIVEFRGKLTSLFDEIKGKMDKGLGKEDIIREVRYEDTVHAEYPPEFSERFNNHIKDSIRRIYHALANK